MVQIKDLVNPGSKEDNEVLYGSGRNNDPLHDGTGTANPLSTSGSTPTSTNPLAPSTSTHHPHTTSASTDPTHRSEVGGSSAAVGRDSDAGYHSAVNPKPFSGHGLGTIESDHKPSSTSHAPGMYDDVATTASIKSGVPGKAQGSSHTQSAGTQYDTLESSKRLPNQPTSTGLNDPVGTTTAGPHSSDLANRADPRVDSDLDGSKGLDGRQTGTGAGLTGSSFPDRSAGSSGLDRQPQTSDPSHFGRDAAVGAGVLGTGAASHHHHPDRDSTGSRSDPRHGPTTTSASGLHSGPTGITGSTTAGPHSSNLSNKVDPRVDSDRDGSTTVGNTGYGSGAGSRDGGLLGTTHTGGAVPGETTHPRSHHEGETASGLHLTDGPHVTDTANRLDPHVDRTRGPLETLEAPHDHSGSGHDPRRGADDAALAGTTGAAGVGAHHSNRDLDSTTDSRSTGPHKSGILNKLDPRVHADSSTKDHPHHSGASDPVGSSGHTTAGTSHLPPSDTSGNPHHHDRGFASAGAGAGGIAALEAGTGISTPAGPYGGRGVDSRVDSKPGATDASRHSGTTHPGKDHHYGRDAGLAGTGGVAAYEAEKHPRHTGASDPVGSLGHTESSTAGTSHLPPSDTSGNPHHHDRGFASAGAGAGGIAGVEAATGISTPAGPYGGPGVDSNLGATDASRHSSTTHPGRDHRYGRDAGLAGTGGVAAYEAEKHSGRHEPTHSSASLSGHETTPGVGAHQSSHEPRSTTDSKSTGPHKLGILNKLDPRVHADPSTKDHPHHTGASDSVGSLGHTESSTAGTSHLPPSDISGNPHHHDRGFASAGAGAGGIAGIEAATGLSTPAGPYGGSDVDPSGHETTHPHTGRDAPLTEGTAGASGAEFSEKEERKHEKALEKEHEKEIKAHEKEERKHEKAIEKEHDKEIKKEIKAHEKEERKHEIALEKVHDKEIKKHEKALEKEEKKHEKELEKEEKKHDEGKKHGGILGFFHRSDKHNNEVDPERQGDVTHGTETGAGAVDRGETDHGKHERNRLHKDPPVGYGEESTSGNGRQVTGGTGTTALAQGGEHPKGSHLTELGDKLDPNIPPRGSSLQHDEPIEPHTGLPIDLSKGTGAGGIDESSAPGYHAHDGPTGTTGTTGDHGTTTGDYSNSRHAGHTGPSGAGTAL